VEEGRQREVGGEETEKVGRKLREEERRGQQREVGGREERPRGKLEKGAKE